MYVSTSDISVGPRCRPIGAKIKRLEIRFCCHSSVTMVVRPMRGKNTNESLARATVSRGHFETARKLTSGEYSSPSVCVRSYNSIYALLHHGLSKCDVIILCCERYGVKKLSFYSLYFSSILSS